MWGTLRQPLAILGYSKAHRDCDEGCVLSPRFRIPESDFLISIRMPEPEIEVPFRAYHEIPAGAHGISS